MTNFKTSAVDCGVGTNYVLYCTVVEGWSSPDKRSWSGKPDCGTTTTRRGSGQTEHPQFLKGQYSSVFNICLIINP